MKPVFVKTSNYRRFTTALSRLDDRGAVEACMVVVDGKLIESLHVQNARRLVALDDMILAMARG